MNIKDILTLIAGLLFASSTLPRLKGDDEPQLTIIGASYGEGREQIDVTECLRPLISHGCLLLRGAWDLGEYDPAPDRTKQVEIAYVMNGTSYRATFQQDQDIILAPAAPALFIVSAHYGTVERHIDVTEKLRTNVAGDTLQLLPEWEIRGIDPAFGLVKSLEITYLFKGELKTVTFDQEHEINLP